LPYGKLVLGTLLILAAIAALPVVGQAQTTNTLLNSKVTPPTPVTPIQHVIVVFGENRSFDHIFGTYQPPAGQSVWNLLSMGIVDAKGNPGPNYPIAHQFMAVDTDLYSIHPGGKTLYTNVPAELVGGPESASDTRTKGDTGPFQTIAVAKEYEPNLDSAYYPDMLTGATGLTAKTVDTRIPNDTALPPGPFQLTSSTLTYDDYAASPVHRFYQMWQQLDCDETSIDFTNPSGCQHDLFPWVEVTIGAGSNGNPQASGFNNLSTGEGGTSMGFYNVSTGDAPYLTSLANQYTLLDNMHQGVMGGTGANHIMLGYADAMAYTDGKGNLATPPYNEIEDPNPQPGTNNWYAEDGYSGGSYTDCSDPYEPGVEPVLRQLREVGVRPNCAEGAYYLLNNYNPGYNGDGSLVSLSESPYTIPPTTQPHIGDVLGAAGLSYTFFGEDWNVYVTDPLGANPKDAYCNICNPFQYATDVMTSAAQRTAHIADMNVFFSEVAAGTVPAVSIIQPSGFVDGHPASSKLDLWEGFVKNIITQVQANSKLWNSTAIILIFDEGGGYYDSGYVQLVDFFGDGTRMPSLIVSPYTTGGKVYHGYADHVSIDKFIERNWNLPPISDRSRDNLPNPTTTSFNPYVPINSPAIDDLFGAFTFPSSDSKRAEPIVSR
jgi:phospholipase C